MNPRQEQIKQRLPQIERVLDDWGCTSQVAPFRFKKKSQILCWLNNFLPSEIDDAFLLLDKIQYQDDQVIRDAIASLSQELIRVLGRRLDRSHFCPLGLSPSSSGGLYLYDFCHNLNLNERQFLAWPPREINSDVEALVFFDDMIGSGNQAIRFFREHLTGLAQPLLYVSVFAFQQGLDRVRADGGFETVLAGVPLSDEERAFGEESRVFQDVTQRLRIKSLAEKYGRLLYPSHPLGYDNTQSLLVFPHNTPNNTLPVIWAGPNNEKAPGKLWSPLWERRRTSGAAARPAGPGVPQHGTPARSPFLHTSFPPFRDILLRRWQEISFEERPHPFPPITNNASPPFPPKLSGEVDYVAGWNIRLLVGARYELTYDFGKNDGWPEIEIVLYQRVPRMAPGGGLWKRVVSAGAVSSGEGASEVTPQSEDWLITCWGKTQIAWDAPWWAFAPETYDLDTRNAVLALSFADQKGLDVDGGLSTFPAMAGSRSALHMRAVD